MFLVDFLVKVGEVDEISHAYSVSSLSNAVSSVGAGIMPRNLSWTPILYKLY